jgi:hypothetical protein
MPAFTFEKISPSKISSQTVRGPNPVVDQKPRSVVFQVLDRFVAVRMKRSLREDQVIIARRERSSQD